MSYLIDTDVLSELRRRNPHPGVVAWVAERPATTLHISVLTLGEIRKGVEGLAAGARRLRLRDWLETDLPAFFAGHILPVDDSVADRWGRLLAAAALTHGLALVTRNVDDVPHTGLEVINPWNNAVA